MSPDQYARLVDDLQAEFEDFLDVVRELTPEQWDLPTPAAGWTIKDQISHIATFNDVAAEALTDREQFGRTRDRFLALGDNWVDLLAWEDRNRSLEDLLSWVVGSCSALVDLLRTHQPDDRMAWFGPDMSAASCATARLMETWAHGQDVIDALGRGRAANDRLAHICHLGVLTRGFAYRLHGLEPPEEPVRVELVDHAGSLRTWGPEDSVDRVSGTMLDFALVVTRRRHLDETGLICDGKAADWLAIAQAYAGDAGAPRGPLASYLIDSRGD